MEAQELVNALKRRGHSIGTSAMSHHGFLLLNVDGRLMKMVDAEELLGNNDEDLLSGIDILACQAEQLIEKFGIEITHAPEALYGSERYRRVTLAYDRLTRAEVQLRQSGRLAEWEQMTIDGRNGSEIVRRLAPIQKLLQAMGEGAPQGKAAAQTKD
jgi:hypothetical protein